MGQTKLLHNFVWDAGAFHGGLQQGFNRGILAREPLIIGAEVRVAELDNAIVQDGESELHHSAKHVVAIDLVFAATKRPGVVARRDYIVENVLFGGTGTVLKDTHTKRATTSLPRQIEQAGSESVERFTIDFDFHSLI